MMIFDASGRAVPLERIYLCQGIEPTQPPPGANGSFYHCVWCESGKFNTQTQLEGHINGKKHVKKLQQKTAKFPSRVLASGYPQGTSLIKLFDTFRTPVAMTNVTRGRAMSSAPSMLVASPAARSNVTADGGLDTSQECLDPELYRRCTGSYPDAQADETTWDPTSVAITNVTRGTAMSSAPSMLVASPAARSNVTADGGSDTSEECLDPPSSSQATRWELYSSSSQATLIHHPALKPSSSQEPQADETTWEAIACETCDVPPDDWAWCPSSFLTLRVGDHLSVLGKDGDWYYGKCGYRSGWFKCSTVTPTSNCENI